MVGILGLVVVVLDVAVRLGLRNHPSLSLFWPPKALTVSSFSFLIQTICVVEGVQIIRDCVCTTRLLVRFARLPPLQKQASDRQSSIRRH
mmetsp:Transcript_17133/g.27790  ORF Transcript_17133/g.27790 Transcript_17133/m.27790 type:complete len:90 (+) Transcript_17133:1639-1908(+)